VHVFRVKKSLSEKKPDDVDLFAKNVQTFMKDVMANFKDYQLFSGRYILLKCGLCPLSDRGPTYCLLDIASLFIRTGPCYYAQATQLVK